MGAIWFARFLKKLGSNDPTVGLLGSGLGGKMTGVCCYETYLLIIKLLPKRRTQLDFRPSTSSKLGFICTVWTRNAKSSHQYHGYLSFSSGNLDLYALCGPGTPNQVT